MSGVRPGGSDDSVLVADPACEFDMAMIDERKEESGASRTALGVAVTFEVALADVLADTCFRADQVG